MNDLLRRPSIAGLVLLLTCAPLFAQATAELAGKAVPNSAQQVLAL